MGAFAPIQNNGVSFEIEAPETLYYANAVNKLALIDRLAISSSTVLNDLNVAISVKAPAGQISLPFNYSLGTLGQTPSVDKNLKIEFDPNLMFQIGNSQQGTIEVALASGETEIAKAAWQIQILPANFWAVQDLRPADYATMAAFVQPNHPSIRPILDEAVADLKARGKEPVLSGYQNLSHVDDMVESIYNAIKARNITYSNPPASWAGLHGQKIRTAQEVLADGVATCLDSAVLFASCLEDIGLEPVLVVVPGHAFVGYWTEERLFTVFDYISDIHSITTHLDLGKLKLFETTTICQGSDATFTQAAARALTNLEAYECFGSASSRSHIINVERCRDLDVGITPMPAKFTEADGTVSIHEYVAREVDIDALFKAAKERPARSGNTVKLEVPPTVKSWLDSLLDLSLRNPLINLKPRRTSVSLLIPGNALGFVEDRLQDDDSFTLTHQAAIFLGEDGELYGTDTAGARGEATKRAESLKLINQNLERKVLHAKVMPDAFVNRLRTIHSEAKLFAEETGSNGLYLALGSLHWKPNSSRDEFIDSPLIMVPVTLTARNRNKEFSITLEESGVTPNFSLVEKLRVEFGLNLDGLANLERDNLGVDVDGTLRYVREELIKAKLNDFRVDETASLGLFNFSSFRLWKDLLDNWQKFERNPLVKHLIHSPTEAFEEPVEIEPTEDLDALIAQLPIPADGSQAAAVAKASAGHSFILQGPPGTGKSQTITNLLAHALDQGLRVLFVAEKKDALDVVKERMDASGIGAFSLDLHDKSSTSKGVRQQLDEVIDILVEPDKSGFDAALQDYEAALGPLRNYREQLHKEGSLGYSIYSAKDEYLVISSEYEMQISGEILAKMQPGDKEALLKAAREITNFGMQAGNAKKNAWSLSKRQTKIVSDELSQIAQLSVEIVNNLNTLTANSDVKEFIESIESLEDLDLLGALNVGELPATAIDFAMTGPGREQLDVAMKALKSQKNKISALDYSIEKLEKVNLDEIDRLLQEALTANALMRGLKLGKPIKLLTQQLGTNAAFTKDNIAASVETLQQIEKLNKKSTKELAAVTGLRFEDEPNLYSSEGIDVALDSLTKLAQVGTLATFTAGSADLPKRLATSVQQSQKSVIPGFLESFRKLLALLDVDDIQTNLWRGKDQLGIRLIIAIEAWARDSREFGQSDLIRWNDLMVASAPLIEKDLRSPLNEVLSGAIPFESAANSFLKGFYKALFQNLLVVHGLHSFDGISIDNYIKQLEAAHEGLRRRLPKVLAAELLSRRGFDSSMKIGAIGDLILAIKQSRNSMPLRTLLTKHWDMITRITPCVLASPDSAVRFIDPNFEAFDLVVFDEASQIRVANAIGALGRSKAAVVVGDSKQMPPTSVAQAKTTSARGEEDEDEEDLYLIEPESILTQCGLARMPEIMLNWHYRSEDESLIAFSNQAYYESKLSTFPTPNLGDSDKRLRLEVLKDGQFIRQGDVDKSVETESASKLYRTNPAEARAIVKEIVRRVNDPSLAKDSIGVVTLNKQQRDYIRQLLNDETDAKLTEIMKSGIGADADGNGGTEIFVKNLETVQGSERDVILFSVAFSATKKDRKSFPLNWGPITTAGGEKRLNVAITRARKEVVLFSSFEPIELTSKNPTSRGLKDFGDYLTLAQSSTKSQDNSDVREERLDRHRHEVRTALQEAGLIVLEDIGMSDFKVDIAVVDPKKPGKAVLGILLDGPRWNSRKTVSDRDSLPIQLLTNRMGWPAIERIWLPTWLRDQKGEVQRMVTAFENAKKSSGKAKEPVRKIVAEPIFTKRDEDDLASRTNPVDDLLNKTDMWVEFGSKVIASQDYLNYINQPQIKDAVNDIVRQLVDYEGPVSADRLGKFVAACFGFSRVPANRENQVSYIKWQWSSPGQGRAANQISLCEIANAMKSICEVAGGVRFEQLVKETSKVFGIQKMSKEIEGRFQAAVAWGAKFGRLRTTDEYITASE
jgi:superfamily I DNA and/or RNA helicase